MHITYPRTVLNSQKGGGPSGSSSGGPPAELRRAGSLPMKAWDPIGGEREEDSAGQCWIGWVGKYLNFSEHTT